jgi:ADP-heptose:LPS heptosyltransferase
MYREVHPGLIHVNIICDDGGLGDAIARLPAIKYIADHHKHVQQHLWIHTYMKEFSKNCLRDTNVIIRGLDEKKKFKPRLTRCFSKHLYNNMASHITEHAFRVVVNKDVGPEHLNYLKPELRGVNIIKFNLPKNFVVMTPAFTAPARELYGEYVNELCSYIKNKGYEIVFLGKKETETGTKHVIEGLFSSEIDFNIGLNLMDKTTLLEATKIISQAKALIGLDNGLCHLGGCTDTPLVIGFSNVEPCYRLPYRDNILGKNCYPVVPPISLGCRFCQSNMTFTYSNDFKFCYYKDYACLKQLTPQLYINELEKIL